MVRFAYLQQKLIVANGLRYTRLYAGLRRGRRTSLPAFSNAGMFGDAPAAEIHGALLQKNRA
jgi:hypothetical protein